MTTIWHMNEMQHECNDVWLLLCKGGEPLCMVLAKEDCRQHVHGITQGLACTCAYIAIPRSLLYLKANQGSTYGPSGLRVELRHRCQSHYEGLKAPIGGGGGGQSRCCAVRGRQEQSVGHCDGRNCQPEGIVVVWGRGLITYLPQMRAPAAPSLVHPCRYYRSCGIKRGITSTSTLHSPGLPSPGVHIRTFLWYRSATACGQKPELRRRRGSTLKRASLSRYTSLVLLRLRAD